MARVIQVECLVENKGLEQKITNKLGNHFSSDNLLQRKILNEPKVLTPVYNFTLLFCEAYLEILNIGVSNDHRRDMVKTLDQIFDPYENKRDKRVFREKLTSMYKASRNIDLNKELEKHEMEEIIVATDKSLQEILRNKGVNRNGIFNPDNVHTEGLLVFLNQGVLITDYNFIDGLYTSDLKYYPVCSKCR